MRVAVSSASASVSHALDALIRMAGHLPVAMDHSAELVLIDTFHPVSEVIDAANGNTPCLRLVAVEADPSDLRCPLRPTHLVQRLNHLAQTQPLPMGDRWQLDPQLRQLQDRSHAHRAIDLTEKECQLLQTLLVIQPQPMPRQALLAQVWGVAAVMDTHTLETHIYRLRSKLADIRPRPCDILTQDGAYVLAFDEKPG